MFRVYKLGALVCVIVLSTTEVLGRYKYVPEINGWIMVHKVAETWEEAFQQCRNETAVLMSPNQMDLYSAMMALVDDNTTYFIGTQAAFHRKIFVSIEGVLLYDMPVAHMFSQLNLEDGACLSMNRDTIRVVSCASRLPYMCYKEKKDDLVLTECGTFDKRYVFNNSTGSCYKFHEVGQNWPEAYSTCIDEGGYLVIVNDHTEVVELMKINGLKQTTYIHVGIRCFNTQGNWRSVLGHSLEQIYNKWTREYTTDEVTCAIGLMSPEDERLYTDNLRSKYKFLCEKDPNYILFSDRSQV